jgi:intein/homing endonuclease
MSKADVEAKIMDIVHKTYKHNDTTYLLETIATEEILKTLKAELLAKMPNKMTIADSPSEEAYINGYSEAITEITKIIEEL